MKALEGCNPTSDSKRCASSSQFASKGCCVSCSDCLERESARSYSKVYRLRLQMSSFGALTKKPTYLYSNHLFIKAWTRILQMSSSASKPGGDPAGGLAPEAKHRELQACAQNHLQKAYRRPLPSIGILSN